MTSTPHLQTLHHTNFEGIPPPSTNGHSASWSSTTYEDKFELEENPKYDTNFVGIPNTLTTDIYTVPTQSIHNSHAHFTTPRWAKLKLVILQRLLTLLTHSMYRFNPLYTLIPNVQCFKFDKWTHNLYFTATIQTQTQSVHATFLARKYHGLHILSMFNQQFKSYSRKLDFRLHPSNYKASNTPNLIHITITYLRTYGIFFRNTNQPIITKLVQNFLHHTTSVNKYSTYQSDTIHHIRRKFTHIMFTHQYELHKFIIALVSETPNRLTIIPYNNRHFVLTNTHCINLIDTSIYLSFVR